MESSWCGVIFFPRKHRKYKRIKGENFEIDLTKEKFLNMQVLVQRPKKKKVNCRKPEAASGKRCLLHLVHHKSKHNVHNQCCFLIRSTTSKYWYLWHFDDRKSIVTLWLKKMHKRCTATTGHFTTSNDLLSTQIHSHHYYMLSTYNKKCYLQPKWQVFRI